MNKVSHIFMVSKNKVLQIFKASPTPVSILKAKNNKFIYVQVNTAYEKLTGKTESTLLGNSLFDVFTSRDSNGETTGAPQLLKSFQKVLKNKSTDIIDHIRYDIEISAGDIREMYFKVENTPVLDDEGEVEFIINTAIDISSQVISDRINRLMLDNTEDSFIYINKKLIIERFNSLFEENYESIFGVKIKKGDSILDYASKDRKEIVKGIYKQVFEGSTIVSNLKFDTLDGEKRYFTIKYKPAYDQQNNIIGSFISLLEKTAEQKAKIELEKNEAHFRALVENGSDVLFILKPDGNPKYISPSIKNVLGYTVDEAMSLNMTNSVHPDDLEMMMQEIGKCLAKPGEPMQVPPARLKDKQGEWHWFEGTLTNMLHDPAIEGIVDNFREVTERIEAEKDILDSKNKYQSLIQSINGIIWEDDPETLELTFLSAQCEQILGFSPKEWLNDKGFWKKHLHPNDRKRISKLYKQRAKVGQDFELEYRFKNASEEYVWIRDFITVENRKGSPAIVRGLMIDITEEKELKDNLDEAYKLAQIGTWEYDLKNRKISLSNIVKEILEVEDEGKGLSVILSVHEDNENRKRFKSVLKKTIREGSAYDEEFRIISGKGKVKWIRSLGKADLLGNKTVRIFGSVQDITERKRVEQEREFERLNKHALINSTNDLLWSIDKNFNLITANHAFTEGVKEQIGIPISTGQSVFKVIDLRTGYGRAWKTNYERALKGEVFRLETYEPNAGEKIRYWHETTFNPIYEGNEITGVACFSRNITHSKEAEIKLRVAEEKYKNVVEHSTNMFYQHDLEGVLTYVSPKSTKFLGYSPEEAKKHWTEFLTDNPINQIGEQRTLTALKTGEVQPTYEIELRRKDGSLFWVEVNEAPLLKNGAVIGIVGSLTNITERKEAKNLLELSEKRYKALAQEGSELIGILDKEFKFKYIGPAQGMNYDAYLGTNSFCHIHPDDRSKIEEALKKISSEKRMVLPIYRLKDLKGKYHWVETIMTDLLDEPAIEGYVVNSRNVNERVKNEEGVRASLNEKETLLAEIHHRVKNNLAVASGMLQLQAFETVNKDLQDKLFDSVLKIKTMATVHELLYQSNSFTQVDFSENIKKLIENIEYTHQDELGTKVGVETECENIKLNINMAIPASLIVNEVITNCYKHAFVGRKTGKIKITVSKKEQFIELKVEDDGIGLPFNFNPQNQSSLGLHLIDVLNMQIEGVYNFSSDKKGTSFKMKFPISENKTGIGNAGLI